MYPRAKTKDKKQVGLHSCQKQLSVFISPWRQTAIQIAERNSWLEGACSQVELNHLPQYVLCRTNSATKLSRHSRVKNKGAPIEVLANISLTCAKSERRERICRRQSHNTEKTSALMPFYISFNLAAWNARGAAERVTDRLCDKWQMARVLSAWHGLAGGPRRPWLIVQDQSQRDARLGLNLNVNARGVSRPASRRRDITKQAHNFSPRLGAAASAIGLRRAAERMNLFMF